ncbi:MAG: metallophosphoesterase [bacterium]
MSRRLPLLLAFLLLAAAACGNGPADPPPGPAASATPTPVPVEVRFFTFGDWGTGTPSQIAVADAVTQNCLALGCDFGLLLGDNFYPSGVATTSDPQWQSRFEAVYDELPGPFFAVLGNHDYDGNEQAEIDYSSLQGRWKMPGRSYTIAWPPGAPDPVVEIFVVDSNAFDAASAAELQARLAASTARWKLLALHHPVYSNGLHGDDSAGINALLLPAICGKIDAVLAGHDHLFSHLEDPNDGCAFSQFVIGTGGKDLYNANPDPRALYSESTFGFAILEIQSDKLRLEFRRADGSLAYAFALQK